MNIVVKRLTVVGTLAIIEPKRLAFSLHSQNGTAERVIFAGTWNSPALGIAVSLNVEPSSTIRTALRKLYKKNELLFLGLRNVRRHKRELETTAVRFDRNKCRSSYKRDFKLGAPPRSNAPYDIPVVLLAGGGELPV